MHWMGGIIFLLFFSGLTTAAINYEFKKEYDICNPETPSNVVPPTVYLGGVGNTTEVFAKMTSNGGYRECHMYFKTCPSCRFKVEALSPFTSVPECRFSHGSLSGTNECIPRCTHLLMFDSDYRKETLRVVTSADDVTNYQSEAAHLHIWFCGNSDFLHNGTVHMRLNITSIQKREEIKTWANPIFTSPYFPASYQPNSEIYTYHVQAIHGNFITITFHDWLLYPFSEMEFSGSLNKNSTNGLGVRPFIISDGPELNITFHTGVHRIFGGLHSFPGFKAEALAYPGFDQVPLFKTDCDKTINSADGGVLTMGSASDRQNRDCIRIIKRLSTYDGVYVKIIRYKISWETQMDKFIEYSLEVRGGITSEAPLLLAVKPTEVGVREYNSMTANDGIYIRTRGRYHDVDDLVVVYSMYIEGCNSYRAYHKCDNGRCIPERLTCDGYDHCGDNSDEASNICDYTTSTANGNSSSISIGIIIPLVVSVFLVIIMCLIIIFIRRCRRLQHTPYGGPLPPGDQPPPGQGRRRRRRNHGVQMSVTVSSGEHPPSYDEVIQNTPIGYLNMAFSWSQSDHTLAQPPSYEEATSPTALSEPSMDASTIVAGNSSASTANNIPTEDGTSSSQLQHATVFTTTLSASLDPRAEVSSSSSSEDNSGHDNHLDISSSSDSSMENGHSQFSSNFNAIPENSTLATDPNKENKNLQNSAGEIRSRNSVAKPGPVYEGAQVVLGSPRLVKFKAEDRASLSHENYGRGEDAAAHENGSSVTETARNLPERDDNRDRSRGGDSREDRRRREGGGRSRIEENVSACPGSSQAGERGYHTRQRKKHQKTNMDSESSQRNSRSPAKSSAASSDYPGDREWSKPRASHPSNDGSGFPQVPRVTESSRAQSCADLLLDVSGNRRRRIDAGESLTDEDKRFSYAGIGDVALRRGNLDPYFFGRGLVRDRGSEHLDRYASQSYDNLHSGYNRRRHAGRDYEVDDGAAALVQNHFSTPDHNGSAGNRFSECSPYSTLEPVPENSNDDPQERADKYVGRTARNEQRDASYSDREGRSQTTGYNFSQPLQMPGQSSGSLSSSSQQEQPTSAKTIEKQISLEQKRQTHPPVVPKRPSTTDSMTLTPSPQIPAADSNRDIVRNQNIGPRSYSTHGIQDYGNAKEDRHYSSKEREVPRTKDLNSATYLNSSKAPQSPHDTWICEREQGNGSESAAMGFNEDQYPARRYDRTTHGHGNESVPSGLKEDQHSSHTFDRNMSGLVNPSADGVRGMQKPTPAPRSMASRQRPSVPVVPQPRAVAGAEDHRRPVPTHQGQPQQHPRHSQIPYTKPKNLQQTTPLDVPMPIWQDNSAAPGDRQRMRAETQPRRGSNSESSYVVQNDNSNITDPSLRDNPDQTYPKRRDNSAQPHSVQAGNTARRDSVQSQGASNSRSNMPVRQLLFEATDDDVYV